MTANWTGVLISGHSPAAIIANRLLVQAAACNNPIQQTLHLYKAENGQLRKSKVAH